MYKGTKRYDYRIALQKSWCYLVSQSHISCNNLSWFSLSISNQGYKQVEDALQINKLKFKTIFSVIS